MKVFLKVLLWILAILGILLLLGTLAFGVFIYREVDKRVLSYSCENFTQDIDSIPEMIELNDKFNTHMQSVSLISSLTMYLDVKSKLFAEPPTANGIALTEEQLIAEITDGEKFKQTAREFYSYCKEYPAVVPVELFGTFEEEGFHSAAAENFKQQLEKLTIHQSPVLDFYADMMSQEFRRRYDLSEDFNHMINNQSISSTVPTNSQ